MDIIASLQETIRILEEELKTYRSPSPEENRKKLHKIADEIQIKFPSYTYRKCSKIASKQMI